MDFSLVSVLEGCSCFREGLFSAFACGGLLLNAEILVLGIWSGQLPGGLVAMVASIPRACSTS